jgi:hypothetical protein
MSSLSNGGLENCTGGLICSSEKFVRPFLGLLVQLHVRFP